MRILALETSGMSGSVAALDDAQVLAEAPLDPRQRSAQSLAPGIHQLLAGIGWRPADVQLIAVTVGPGSFTGLRVGVTTAKVLAYAVGAEVLGMNTLEVLAEQTPADVRHVEAAIDAHRQQLFTGRFSRNATGLVVWQGETTLIEIDRWLADLEPGRHLTGPVLPKLRERLPATALVTPETCWTPQAAAVGRLAARHYAAGRRDDLWRLVPLYGRASAAEEKRQQPG